MLNKWFTIQQSSPKDIWLILLHNRNHTCVTYCIVGFYKVYIYLLCIQWDLNSSFGRKVHFLWLHLACITSFSIQRYLTWKVFHWYIFKSTFNVIRLHEGCMKSILIAVMYCGIILLTWTLPQLNIYLEGNMSPMFCFIKCLTNI